MQIQDGRSSSALLVHLVVPGEVAHVPVPTSMLMPFPRRARVPVGVQVAAGILPATLLTLGKVSPAESAPLSATTASAAR